MALIADWLSEAAQDAAMRCIGCTPLSQSNMLMLLKWTVIMSFRLDNVL